MIERIINQSCTCTPISKLYYPQFTILIEDENQLLQAFLKQLNFQSFLLPQPSLTYEEVDKLKTIINKLHSHAKEHRLALKQIQGIWPLLSILFTSMNGLQLYLQFEKLLMPIPAPQVKEQWDAFSPNGFFQEDNDWKSDKSIMSALRILERTLKKANYEVNKAQIYKFYELIAVDKAQYLIIAKDFENKLEQFRTSVFETKKLESSNKLITLLSDDFFGLRGTTSEPDLLTNTLNMFSLREVENIYETKTNKIIPIMQQEHEQDENQGSPAKQSETMSPKRQLRIGCSDTTQIPKNRTGKNHSRYFYAKKFFQLQKKQNIVLSEMKTKKALISRERHRRKKLQKMATKSRKTLHYLSDDEDNDRMKKKQVSLGKNRQKDEYIIDYESQAYSASDRMLEEELSEEPMVKRNSKFLKRAPAVNFDCEMQAEEDSHFAANNRSWDAGIDFPTCSEKKQRKNMVKYKKQSIRLNQTEETRKTVEKIENMDIRYLTISDNEEIIARFDFSRYRRFLEVLEGKQIFNEANKVIIELMNRQNIAFDKDLLLKVLTLFSVSLEKEKHQPAWKSVKESKIRIALRFMIFVNIYRGTFEVINCFFDRNEDEATLIQAKEYFKILAKYAQAFKHVGIQQQLSHVFFEANVYRQLKTVGRFPQEIGLVEFANPFLTARNSLKYHLTEHQQPIAFLIGQLAFVSLTLEKFFYDFPASMQKQKQYFSQLYTEFFQMKDIISLRTLTMKAKQFYLIYRPRLNDNYLKGLMNFFFLSFDQLQIKSITEDTDQEAKNQIEFLTTVIQDFIQKEFSKNPPAIGANVYSRVMKTEVDLKKKYQNSKQAIVALLFSMIFSLLLKWPQFRAANLGKELMGTFKSRVMVGLQKEDYKLKPAIFGPIINCIYDLYSYRIELFLKDDHLDSTEKQEYQPIRNFINTAWDKLFFNYNTCFEELKTATKQKKSGSDKSKVELIFEKLKKFEEGFTLFLRLFLLDGAPDRANYPRQSFSHRYFCLQFILKQQHFITFFKNATNYPEYTSRQFIFCLVEVVHRWFSSLPSIDFFFEKYSCMILDLKSYYINYEHKRALEFSLLSEAKQPGIQQSLANIYATQLILALIDHSQKGNPVNLFENPVFKIIEQNTSPTVCSFSKISKSVHIFDHFLNRIIRFFQQEILSMEFLGQNIREKVKKGFCDFIKQKFLKKIIVLVMLAALMRNCYEYESIPLKQIVEKLKRLRLFGFANSSSLQKKANFQCRIFFQEGIQRIEQFNGIQQVLNEIIRWRKQSLSEQQNKRALEGFKSLFQGLINCVKKLSSERQKEVIPIEWMKWATFALQWPQILNHERLLKDRTHLSEFKINTNSIRVFLTFLKEVDGRAENIYKIKEISQVFVENLCRNPAGIRQQQLCKQVRRTLMCIRQALDQQESLTQVSNKLVKKILASFCSPQALCTLYQGSARQRLQIYFEMMEDSGREREGYESLLIRNAKQFVAIISNRMKGYRNLKRQSCETIEALILSCMIGKYSSLLDVKSLLSILKENNWVSSASQKALFKKLERQAEENQYLELSSWCKNQSDIELDPIASWMDIE